MTKSRGENGRNVQILVLIPSKDCKTHIAGCRSFKPPAKYTDKKLLEAVLQAAGMAVEAIEKDHLS